MTSQASEVIEIRDFMREVCFGCGEWRRCRGVQVKNCIEARKVHEMESRSFIEVHCTACEYWWWCDQQVCFRILRKKEEER